jgi:hypothetical protein
MFDHPLLLSFTVFVVVTLITGATVWRGLKSLDDRSKRWVAGFLEQGTAQSSTRLVGILSFMMAALLCWIIVVAVLIAAWVGGDARKALYEPSGLMTTLLISTLTLLFANAGVALGLRKGTDILPPPDPATTDSGPLVPKPDTPTGSGT